MHHACLETPDNLLTARTLQMAGHHGAPSLKPVHGRQGARCGTRRTWSIAASARISPPRRGVSLVCSEPSSCQTSGLLSALQKRPIRCLSELVTRRRRNPFTRAC